ncbi:MAG: YcaO-like family protein [Hyphomicrobiales bacterium]
MKPDKRGKTRVVSGRGINAEEAERRCIAEAAERHGAVFDSDHSLVYASLDELGMSAVDPNSLLLISEAQYASATAWNQTVETDHRLPARFDRKAKIAWTPANEVAGGNTVYVPAAHVYLGYPDAVSDGFPVPDSSGLAAGGSLAAALDRALLELVERDAVAIWWYSREQRPELKIDSGEAPLLDAFADWVRRTDRRFWILDLSHDLRLPVAAAISCDRHGRNLSFGFAAGRSRGEAASSALGELVQFDLTKRLQAGQNPPPPPHFLNWCGTAAIENHVFLSPHPTPHDSSEGRSDIIAALSHAGLRPLFVDLSRDAGELNVVRAIVPGLRPIWPRFAPGRLYDVPFLLDWHRYKLTESELNPVPILY